MKNICMHIQYYMIILTILNFNATFINAIRILGLFAYPAKSHFTFNNAVLRSLANAGHDVTVFTSFPQDVAGENYTRVIDTSNEFSIQVANTTYDEFSKFSAYSILTVAFNHEKPLCEKLWNRKEIQDMMNSKEKLFDVIFVEIFFVYKCMLPLAHKMKIPVIGTTTYKSWIPSDIAANNPNHPAYIPYESSISWNPNNFYERLRNVWNYLTVYYYWNFITVPFLQQFHQDNFQQVMPFADYMSMVPSVIFCNAHHSFVSRPMNPNVIEVGGIHIKPPKLLPKNIEKFIEDAPNGVILFTFGSLIKTASIPNEIMTIILQAFAQIPQRVIMKYEIPLKNVPENVMVLNWLPQRDILEHNNVIAFISHCGQGGVNEAIYTATPILAIPFMFDQRVNAIYLERHGVAVQLELEQITKSTFLEALNNIVNDTKYRDNMQILSKEFKDRPISPQQSVVYWTEYVVRHNSAPHLNPISNELSWFQYLLIDVIIFVLLFVIIVVYILHTLLKNFRRNVLKLWKISCKIYLKKND
ncbi:UDP-glucosyltransferase 2-like [Planococcus citri]|uniref:UDP-glucosyltransferase 2-like n=1 Tax=Planococcus citri TaxID=170843 RepID=UPI0031FA2F12